MRFLRKTAIIIVAFQISAIAQNYDSQINSMKSRIDSDPASNSSVKLLIKLNQVYHKADKLDDALTYYNTLQSENQGETIEAVAVCLSVPILLRKDQYETVKDKCLYVKNNFKGSHWAAESLYNLGELYLNVYQDKENADKYFKELVKDFPNSGLVESARIYLGEK